MYAVMWLSDALDELADAYVQTDTNGRWVLEASINRLNNQLANNPTEVGESRGGHRRIAFDTNCGIYFTVDHPTVGIVRVIHFFIH